MKFNINDQLRFRLTDAGERHLRECLASEARLCNAAAPFSGMLTGSESLPKPLHDGRIQMTAWEVFRVFGPRMYCGATPMFEGNEVEVVK